MESNEQTPGIREGSPPPEGHAYAPGSRQTGSGNIFAESGEGDTGTKETVREGAEEAVGRAREAADEASRRVSEQADEARERSAEQVDRAAEQVREHMGSEETMTGRAAEATADSLERASGYMKSHGNRDIASDIEAYVREHPYQALAGALAAGFILSRVLR